MAGGRFVVTDEHVGPRYAAASRRRGRRARSRPARRHKTLATAERVLRALAAAGLDHDDHVVALGGGVVGDLAGFCAAVYQRGVPVVQVPTTLVAQVDSAYGGKTGVDLPEGKNYVGAYHQPAAVLADPATLATLPAAGAGRGLGRGRQDRADRRRRAVARVRAAARPRSTATSCSPARARSSPSSPRTSATRGRRQVLNLGHTVGHAIETATGYARYRHGEAVGARAARRADAVRAARACATRSPSCSPPAGCRRRSTRTSTSTRWPRPSGATRSAAAGGVGFVLVEAPGDVRTGVPGRAPTSCAAALEELRA